jgi:hypothetical protein
VLIATSIGLGFLERALVPRPKLGSLASQQSQQITTRQALAPWLVVYGRQRTGGIITYIGVTGTNGEFLNLVITLAGHEVNAILNMYFDGVLVTVTPATHGFDATGTYAGFAHVEYNLGTPGQAAFAGLVAADPTHWTSSTTQSNRAGAYVQLKYSADKFPNSLPNVTFDIQGRKLFDPRTGRTSYFDSLAPAGSQFVGENPALCIRDYLTNGGSDYVTRTGAKDFFGLGCKDAEINDASFIAAANNCDEVIALKSGGTLSGGGNQRYLCNGGFTTDQRPADILNQLLSSMAGYLTWQNGKWSVFAGVWRAPTTTLTDDDLRDAVRVQVLASRSSLMNQVKGAIINPTQAWQPADFAAYAEDSAHGFATDQWRTQDNGEQITTQIQLPFTIDSPMAQRLAKILLERTRRQMRATWPCKLTAYRVQVPDVVNITRSRYSWTNKTFEVQQCTLSLEPDSEGVAVPAVDLALAETDANVYAWDPVTEELPDPAPGAVALPNGSVVGAPSALVLTTIQTTRADGIKASFIQATWTAPTDQMVLSGGKIAVQYRPNGTTPWITADIVAGDALTCNIDGVNEGSAYDVRIYSLNTSGASSSVVQQTNFTVARSASNVSYRPTSNPLTATDAGASDTVAIANFLMRVAGIDVSITGNSITSLSRKTLYFIYYTDLTIAGGAVSFSASTVKEDALSGSGKFFVGSIVTPAAGSSSTVGNNDGGSGAENGDTFILSPTIYSIAAGQWIPVGVDQFGGHDGNSYAVVDRDTSTPGSAIMFGAGDFTWIFAGFPAFSNRFNSLKLNVKSGGHTSNNAGNTATMDYSTDGFSTSTTIWTIGANAVRAAALDQFTISSSVAPGNIQIRLTLHVATGGSSEGDIYEIWVEGQQ